MDGEPSEQDIEAVVFPAQIYFFNSEVDRAKMAQSIFCRAKAANAEGATASAAALFLEASRLQPGRSSTISV